jgi:hypothetical protein
MIAEWSIEHDRLFDSGCEYLPFTSELQLVSQVRRLLADDAARRHLGTAARKRCMNSGYSGADVAKEMLAELRLLL